MEMIAGTLVDEKHLWTAPNIEPRCKNCRFWRREQNGVCEMVAGSMFVGDWSLSGDTAAASYDDSSVHTGENFGCIHFEVKDEM